MTDQAQEADELQPEAAPDPAHDAAHDDGGGAQEVLLDQPRVSSPEQLRGALEALLLIADEPVSETNLAAALRVPTDEVAEALAELRALYAETGRGFELRKVAGGWRYYTREDYADLIGAYVLEGQVAKLSQAALETLAVIAYLQPVSRSRVSAVRGVNVDGVVRTLLARDLITETGAEESGATLFRTTDYFLERMGLQSLEELPELAPYLPEATELEEELGQLAVVPAAEPAAEPVATESAAEQSADPEAGA
ncbi:SMC-Scp complex subunit ScpB [Microlunatus endophyticus]|nr:SMC-Scp complex subunit ScpB [Microlunatus endophyticus]